MNPSHLPSITCPLPGIFLSMNDINTNYFPCLMLFHVFSLGSVANLHSSIYILNNDTFQFNISLDITFPIFRNCVTPTHICFLPLHSEFQLCCWVGRILTGVSWFQRKQSHSGRMWPKKPPWLCKILQHYVISYVSFSKKKKKIIPAAEIISCETKNKTFFKKQTFISRNYFMMVLPPVIFYKYT